MAAQQSSIQNATKQLKQAINALTTLDREQSNLNQDKKKLVDGKNELSKKEEALKEEREKLEKEKGDAKEQIKKEKEEAREQIKKEKEKWEKEKEEMKKKFPIEGDIIELNVGGSHFTTYKSTLCKVSKKKSKCSFSFLSISFHFLSFPFCPKSLLFFLFWTCFVFILVIIINIIIIIDATKEMNEF